jgi:hypothetical protein
MDPKSKQVEMKKVPMRKLLASVKLDIRKTLKQSSKHPKPMKKK